jgi:hypothetical protein
MGGEGEGKEEVSRQSGYWWKFFSNALISSGLGLSHLTSSYLLSCLVGSHHAGGRAVAPHWWVSMFYFPSVLSNEKHLHPVNLSFALIKVLDVGYWGLFQARCESIRWST